MTSHASLSFFSLAAVAINGSTILGLGVVWIASLKQGKKSMGRINLTRIITRNAKSEIRPETIKETDDVARGNIQGIAK